MFIEIFIIFQKKKQDYFFFIVLSLSVESILVSLLLIPDEKEGFIVFFLTWYPNLSQSPFLSHPFSSFFFEKGRKRQGRDTR